MARRKSREEATATGPLLERLAVAIATQALDENGKPLTFDQKVDAFKAITNYFAMRNKLGTPHKEGAFNGFGKQIEDLGRGGNPGIAVEPGAEPDF